MAMMRRGRGRGRGGIAAAKADHGLSNSPLDLVRSEVAILKKLSHRNVIKLYEVLDDPNDNSLYMGMYIQAADYMQDILIHSIIYLVLEMAHKGVIMQIDLHQAATPYTESASRYYFRQMILGIEYRKSYKLLKVSHHLFGMIVHCNDIVHRGMLFMLHDHTMESRTDMC